MCCVYSIILASGTGSRLNLGYNKVFAQINNLPVLYYTMKNFEDCDLVDEVLVTVGQSETHAKEKKVVEAIIDQHNFKKIKNIVSGGDTRMNSVQNGLDRLGLNDDDIVVIQDGARPFTKLNVIEEVIQAAQKYGSAVCGVTPKDTIQLVDKDGFSVKTLARDGLVSIQTPMAAKWSLLQKARFKASKEGFLNKEGFEDSALLQQLGESVKIVESDYGNIKITTKEDFNICPLPRAGSC